MNDRVNKHISVQASEKARYWSLIKDDAYHQRKMDFFINRFSKVIDEYIPDTQNRKFLEVGFGDGTHLEALAKGYPAAVFTGIEVGHSSVDGMITKGYNCSLVTE